MGATELISKLLSIAEVAAILGVSVATMHRRLKDGKFPRGSWIGRERRWTREEVEAARDGLAKK